MRGEQGGIKIKVMVYITHKEVGYGCLGAIFENGALGLGVLVEAGEEV